MSSQKLKIRYIKFKVFKQKDKGDDSPKNQNKNSKMHYRTDKNVRNHLRRSLPDNHKF